MNVTVYEVGPRDGLQALSHTVSIQDRKALIGRLYDAGLNDIEEVSFVHPKVLPQMSGAESVFSGRGSALVLNPRGFQRAMEAGVERVNIVMSPCESFNIRNFRRRHHEIMLGYRMFLHDYPKEKVRVYISMAFGSPDSGKVHPKDLDRVVRDAKMFGKTVVFSDTIGAAHDKDIVPAAELAQRHGLRPALHLHHKGDEMEAIGLIRTGLLAGIREFDSSIAGLGGCPFIETSGANLSTMTLVKHLEAWGFEHGVDIERLRQAEHLAQQIRHPPIENLWAC